jgi:hypothetical protein
MQYIPRFALARPMVTPVAISMKKLLPYIATTGSRTKYSTCLGHLQLFLQNRWDLWRRESSPNSPASQASSSSAPPFLQHSVHDNFHKHNQSFKKRLVANQACVCSTQPQSNLIDKTSSAELSEAINSMFRWYQEAEVCYAYLADVPTSHTVNGLAGHVGSKFLG